MLTRLELLGGDRILNRAPTRFLFEFTLQLHSRMDYVFSFLLGVIVDGAREWSIENKDKLGLSESNLA